MRIIRGTFYALLCVIVLAGCGGKDGADSDGTNQEKVQDQEAEESVRTETVTDMSDDTGQETKEERADKGEKAGAGEPAELVDGVYTAEFHTDSSMFHVNEACEGRGTLTVENGEMTIHISLASKNIVNLYPGFAADAGKEGEEALLPTEDTVTYSDGMTEEVYGFDVPVPVLEEEFDLALIGTKGTWYDHKVSVSDPVPVE